MSGNEPDEELYMVSDEGKIPISREEAKKYELKKGSLSPFTGRPIVGKEGWSKSLHSREKEEAKEPKAENLDAKLVEPEDGMVELENGALFSTSEILDISQGVDSSVESNDDGRKMEQ